ncbi:unnamed protein product [Urochloa decumbens]|uniref:SWIM-type domain-containing protein n=1 Tax=Urochloa decumbens TaxID=240449 RepID=A0ABC9DGV4_9POAL
MDLNELPPEFDSDFLDDSSGNPFYCTQPSMYNVSSVGQQSGSLQNQFAVTYSEQFGSPQDHDHVTNAIGAREQFDAGASEQVAIGAKEQFDAGGSEHFDVGVNEHVDVTNEAPTHEGISVSGFEAHGGDENVVGDIAIEDADEIDDEIWSTPPIPYTGQSFDNKKEARQFYNMYAKRIGFSIRTGTTRLAAITREQRKVTYVCNKEGRGRKAKEDKANDESDEDESIEEISEQEDNNDGAGKKRKKLDGVPYVGKDVSNFRSTIRRREKYKDMQETLDYFIELEEEDPEFFYKVKLDDRNRVESLFWVDGAARHAYIESYHDYVSFDATYMTNMYDMPCAPFIGINAHGQTFQLGCAFIRDEKTPSYKWLFETFLMAMKGPILDEDEELNEDFKECVNHTVTPSEFEGKWSTQRSEGFNAVMKKYVNPNMSILHFVRQYQKVQEKCLVAEEGQDFKTDDRERRRWSKYPIERHAASVYTKNLFYRFSKEFEKTAEYDVKPAGEFQYLLVPNNTIVYGYGKREYLVTAIEGDNSYFCECSKFDRDGILCCHIIKIMTRFGVKTIPDRYVLRRWTQKAVEDSEKCASNAHLQADLIARGMPLNNRKTFAGSMAAVGNPPRSNVKGRKKEKRFKKGMNAEPKRKNKCRLCKSTEHNAARCPMKGEEKGLDLGGVTAQ